MAGKSVGKPSGGTGRRLNGYWTRQAARTAENKRKRIARNEQIRKRALTNKQASARWSGKMTMPQTSTG